jgi:hypothetical protein
MGEKGVGDGGKRCGVADSGVSAMGKVKSGVSVMKKKQRVADNGVSATEESQKC